MERARRALYDMPSQVDPEPFGSDIDPRMVEIRSDDPLFTADAFLALAQRVWPRAYDRERTAAALARSANVGAWDGVRLVGAVRVLSDGYLFACVSEILVDPDYQRRGLGRRLMDTALAAAPRGKLFLGAQPEAVGFFERLGYARGPIGFVAARPEAADPSDAAP
jgi:GNAT superfamily N-acetyltransferase